MKILVCPPNYGGCGQYRVVQPMQKLEEKFPNDVDIRFDDDPLGWSTEDPHSFTFDNIKWADVVFTANIHKYGGEYTLNLARVSKELGKFYHFDTDDLLTELYEGHRHYQAYKDNNLENITKAVYGMADLVSVTQIKFAERVAQYVQSGCLAVIKNAIDFDLPCWNMPPVKAKKGHTRIGWVGGIHHEEDVKPFHGVMLSLAAKVGAENVEWRLHGKPPPNADNDKEGWQQDVWKNYEAWLTSGAKKSNVFVGYALPSDKYGVFYSQMDISIAPLLDNPFNDSKSEIKLMECGRYGLPLVCTDVGAYSEIIENGKTGYLISKNNPKSEWIQRLTKLCKDPDHRREMGQNLKKIVDERYNSNLHIGDRLKIYHELIKQKKEYLEALKNVEKEKRNTETVQEEAGNREPLESEGRGCVQGREVPQQGEDEAERS